MFIFLERKTFQGFDPNKLTLLYPSCRASYNDSHISLRTSLNDCGTTHNESEDAITFYNKVRSVQSYSGNIITREQNVSIPFYCSYGRKALLRNPSFKTWKNHFTASEGNLLQGNAHLITSVLRYNINFITTRVIVQFNEFISFKGKHSLNKPFLKKKTLQLVSLPNRWYSFSCYLTLVRFYDLYCFPELNELFVFAQVQFDFLSILSLFPTTTRAGWSITFTDLKEQAAILLSFHRWIWQLHLHYGSIQDRQISYTVQLQWLSNHGSSSGSVISSVDGTVTPI